MIQKHTVSNVVTIFLLLILFFVSGTLAASGDIDPAFTASDARVLTRVGTSDSEARDVLVQPDGKIIVIGKGAVTNISGDFAVVRYNLDGSLDMTFGIGGKAIVAVGIQDSRAIAAVLQSDGKILVVGEARANNVNGTDFALVRFNPDGSLDESFGSGGKVISPFIDNSIDTAVSVALQTDGKIVVGGRSNALFAVARYHSNGSLDLSFGINGKTTTALGNLGDFGQAVVVQTDGKIILAGNTSSESGPGNAIYQIGLVRYNSDGSLDSSFDSDGKVLTLIGNYSICRDVVLQANGKIIIGGTATSSSGGSLDFAMARYNQDGSLDASFGNGGKVLTPVSNGSDTLASLTLRADGKLIAAGVAQQIFGTAPFSEANGDFALVQYNSDGTPDLTFGSGGKVITPVATTDGVGSAALQADGKIVVAGSAAPLATLASVAVVRYHPNGTLDQSFGYKVPGSVSTVVRGTIDEARAVVVQPDGKIVSAGRARVTNRYYFAVSRQNPDGTLDTDFGSNGTLITKIGAGDTDSEARAVALQADGKIVVAGRIYDANNSSLSLYYFALTRYNSDGTLDQTFGNSGIVVVPAANESNEAFAVAVQPNGKIVAAGFYDTLPGFQTAYDLAVVRLESNGLLDTSFDQDGIALTDLGSDSETAFSLALQSDGKILIAGSGGVNFDFAMVRYNINGALDTEFGTNGKILTPVGTSLDEIRSVVVQPDGKIIAAGNARVGSQSDFAVVRYNSNGTLDPTFDGDGKVITPITTNSTDLAWSVLVLTNGKIIVVGSTATGTGTSFNSDIAIVRYTSTGTLDVGFSGDGIVTTDYAGYGYSGETATSAALVPNGKLIVAGSIRDRIATGFSGDRRNFLLARYFVNNETPFDFDGDGKSDISVFRPSNGVWYLQQSQTGFTGIQFGVSTDKLTPADYDGDGKTDVAIYRGGIWYLQRSQLGFTGIQFGAAEDIPAPADYDGDGKADLAVFRPSNGTWYLQRSQLGFTGIAFGQTGDKPVPADYDGDGKADIAVNRAGVWYLQRSQLGFTGLQFGTADDKLVPADYDGDGKADVAVFRPSNGVWYLQQSTDGFAGIQFGLGTDLPTAADYDGDGRADLAVFRNGTWYLNRSSAGFTGVAFGASSDLPIPSAFVR